MILGKYGIIPKNNAEKEVIMLHFLLTLAFLQDIHSCGTYHVAGDVSFSAIAPMSL